MPYERKIAPKIKDKDTEHKVSNLIHAIFNGATTKADYDARRSEFSRQLRSFDKLGTAVRQSVTAWLDDVANNYGDRIAWFSTQNLYTADTIATSRVEAQHGVEKRAGNLNAASSRADNIEVALRQDQDKADRVKYRAFVQANQLLVRPTHSVLAELYRHLSDQTLRRLEDEVAVAKNTKITGVSPDRKTIFLTRGSVDSQGQPTTPRSAVPVG